jgi:hypothetical protein
MTSAQYRDVLTHLGLTQVAAALEDRTCLVAEFLRDALADEALDVPELEVMARAAGPLGRSAHQQREGIQTSQENLSA